MCSWLCCRAVFRLPRPAGRVRAAPPEGSAGQGEPWDQPGNLGKVLLPHGVLTLSRLPRNGHSPQAARAPGAFRMHRGIVGGLQGQGLDWMIPQGRMERDCWQ